MTYVIIDTDVTFKNGDHDHTLCRVGFYDPQGNFIDAPFIGGAVAKKGDEVRTPLAYRADFAVAYAHYLNGGEGPEWFEAYCQASINGRAYTTIKWDRTMKLELD